MAARAGRDAPTLESVAARAGVSRATAGRVLAGAGNVSEHARDAVLRAAAELSYVTNRAARSLMTRRSDSIAYVVAEPEDRFFADPYFALLLRGVHAAVAARDVQLVFVVLHGRAERERFRRFARGGHLDGVVFVSLHGEDPLPLELQDAGIPVVLSGRPYPGQRTETLAFVDADNVGGGRSAATLLARRGCRHPGTITGPLDMAAALDRDEGFRAGLAAAGLGPPVRAHGDFSIDGGRRAMGELLAAGPDVDGIFVANDLMALGALQAAADAGRRVPADLAVIGFDDIPLAASSRPALTTVRQPMTEMGAAMAGLLLDIVDGRRPRDGLVLPTELVCRDSA